jgi:hypothetical protein
MGRYRPTILELLFVPELHTDTYQYVSTISIYIFLIFLTVYLCFVFKVYRHF